MGVPGFFAWLKNKYKKDNFILKKQQVNNVDYLLFDANGLVHPVCREIVINNPDINDIIMNEYTLSLKKDDTESFLNSSISMTNWKDEIIDLNCFGFMINYKISKLSYKGFISDNETILSNYPNIFVNNIVCLYW